MKKKSIYNVYGVIAACLQPTIWYIVFRILDTPKGVASEESTLALCSISCLAMGVASLYIGQFFANGKENPW